MEELNKRTGLEKQVDVISKISGLSRSAVYKKINMNKISILLFCLISTCLTIACKKENPVKEKFDFKNYAIHHVYRESNGRGTEYKAPLQIIIIESNSKLNIKHSGATTVANLPVNITAFNVYDGFIIIQIPCR